MNIRKLSCCFILFLAIALFSTSAQTTQKNQTGQKKDPNASGLPKLSTKLGSFAGKSLLALQLKPFIDSALRVVDEKGIQYEIDSYQLFYRKKEETFNDETNKKEYFFYTLTYKNSGPVLPESWRNSIKLSLKKDEEISFEQIIVKDKNGKLILAPDYNIQVL
jgi:hypothetical protein